MRVDADNPIHLFKPVIPLYQEELEEAVVEVLRSRFIGQGPKVDLFEKKFEELFGVKFAVSLNSGTSALETAYDLIGLKPGDEVITTPLTCTATNLPLIRMGVKIVFADILEETLNIDPIDVRAKITERTKAIVQVHLGGIKSDVGFHHIPVVSDACQALGVFTGDYTCISFQAIKHITTGDGGMLVTNNQRAYDDAKLLRWFGIDREKKIAAGWQAYKERQMTFDIKLPGTKRQMTDIDAAMGIVGLKYYQQILSHRKKIFNIYKEHLANVPGVIRVVDGKENTCWLATLLVERRDEFANMLYRNHVDTNLVQIRNDLFSIFGGCRQDLPTMNRVEDKYISIPVGMNVTEEHAHYIVNLIKRGW